MRFPLFVKKKESEYFKGKFKQIKCVITHDDLMNY